MRRVAVALLSATLVLAACSSDDPTLDESPTPTESPTMTDEPSPTATDTETEAQTEVETETEPALPTDGPTTSEPEETEGGSPIGAEADMVLTAELTGSVQVPGPGDPSGSGSFESSIVLNEAAGELCYELEVDNLGSEVTAAHIHAGAEGEQGDIHIELTPPLGGPVEECVTVNATELVPLMDNPDQYYVNVHSQGHPDGAVRGQLEAN